MLPILLLTIGQLTIDHRVAYVTPTELMAALTVSNPTPDVWRNVTIYSFIGPPAEPLVCLPLPSQTIPMNPGVLHVIHLGDLPPFDARTTLARVRVPAGASWAHAAFVDAVPERTGVPRFCNLYVSGPQTEGIPTLGGFGMGALALLMGGALVWRRRRTR